MTIKLRRRNGLKYTVALSAVLHAAGFYLAAHLVIDSLQRKYENPPIRIKDVVQKAEQKPIVKPSPTQPVPPREKQFDKKMSVESSQASPRVETAILAVPASPAEEFSGGVPLQMADIVFGPKQSIEVPEIHAPVPAGPAGPSKPVPIGKLDTLLATKLISFKTPSPAPRAGSILESPSPYPLGQAARKIEPMVNPVTAQPTAFQTEPARAGARHSASRPHQPAGAMKFKDHPSLPVIPGKEPGRVRPPRGIPMRQPGSAPPRMSRPQARYAALKPGKAEPGGPKPAIKAMIRHKEKFGIRTFQQVSRVTQGTATFSPPSPNIRVIRPAGPGNPLKGDFPRQRLVSALGQNFFMANALPLRISAIPADFRKENSGSEHEEDEINLGQIRAGFSSKIWARIARKKYYPNLARDRGYEGQPVVAFTLGENGELIELSLLRTSG
ncbi:MAG: hypothetical protein ACE5E9_05740, partial [Nitrospinaceae bacterium]